MPTALPDVPDVERHVALLCGLDTDADHVGHPTDERGMYVSVRRFLEALAPSQPVCLFLEDLHWADAALLNLLEHVAERASGAPLLIVTQARPELLDRRLTWGGGIRAFTSLLLEPMDREDGLALAEALCRDRGLSDGDAEQVSRIAGGNPLFVEEPCATLSEGREAGGVPTALRALVSARLDALPSDERRVLLHAAVFGTYVWRGGLAALDPSIDLLESREALERRDLLRSQATSRFVGQREYAFKHDPIHEMAYGLLPRAERRRLHALSLDWLEAAAGERSDEILDVLAHHAISAYLPERAIDYLTRGAERAMRAAAHREQAGFHLDVFDYAGHASLAQEASDVARSFNFLPSFISATIDLLMNRARTGEVGNTDLLEREVAAAVERTGGWHGWLWSLRFAEARAELALASGDFEQGVWARGFSAASGARAASKV